VFALEVLAVWGVVAIGPPASYEQSSDAVPIVEISVGGDESPAEPALGVELATPAEDPEPEQPPVASPPPRSRAEVVVELGGMIGLAGTYQTAGLTFGGPKIGLTIGHLGIGVSAYPSLLYSHLWDTHRVRPSLGFGGEISYYGVAAFVAVSHAADRYLPAAGLGYRFLFRRVRVNGRDERRGRAGR
jgi:hypothetical protein